MTVTILNNRSALFHSHVVEALINQISREQRSHTYSECDHNQIEQQQHLTLFDLTSLLQNRAAAELNNSSRDDDEDCCSVSPTLSDDSSVSSSCMKKLRFADPLVTQVKTRPRTQPKDVRQLFYSSEEIAQFREDYYELIDSEEEKSESIDHYQGETNSSSDRTADDTSLQSLGGEFEQLQSSGFISKVSIDYQGKAHVMYSQDEPSSKVKDSAHEENFFDNAAFWNGSITWWY